MTTISSTDTSLLLKLLDRGSGENLRAIFKRLSSLKDKIRIERVCRTFRKHANSNKVWTSVTNIIIRDEYDHYQINEEQICADRLASAVSSVLSRTHNLQMIGLYVYWNPVIYSLIVECIRNLGKTAFRKLKWLEFYRKHFAIISSHVTPIIETFNTQLTTLVLSANYFMESKDQERLWKCIGECSKLKKIIYYSPLGKGDRRLSDLMKKALRNKPIDYLNLNIAGGISSDDLIEIITLRSQQEPMKYFVTSNEYITLVDLFNKIPAIHWIGLQGFTYDFHVPLFEGYLFYASPNWAIARKLPQLLPQLKRLSLYSILPYKSSQIVDLIISYLSILNENQEVQRSLVLQLKISSLCGPKDWKEVSQMLVSDHPCETEELEKHVIRIHRKDQGSGFIDLCW